MKYRRCSSHLSGNIVNVRGGGWPALYFLEGCPNFHSLFVIKDIKGTLNLGTRKQDILNIYDINNNKVYKHFYLSILLISANPST